MIDDKRLGSALRNRREECALTQDGLANAVGLNQFIIGRIESGQRPCRATELVSIAAALNTTVDALLRSATGPDFSARATEAAAARNRAHQAVLDYLAAHVRAYGAQAGTPDPHTSDGEACADPDEFTRWLARTSPSSDALVPADAVESARAAIAALVESVAIVPTTSDIGTVDG